jgi:hypothetical protein
MLELDFFGYSNTCGDGVEEDGSSRGASHQKARERNVWK